MEVPAFLGMVALARVVVEVSHLNFPADDGNPATPAMVLEMAREKVG